MWNRFAGAALKLFREGGPVIAIIFLVSLVGWVLLFRLFLGRPVDGGGHSCSFVFERMRLLDLLARQRGALAIVALLAAATPLLGLLGTVLGMMTTFDSIGREGLARSGALAGGVSQALLTTQVGLLAALSLLAGHAAATKLMRRREQRARELA